MAVDKMNSTIRLAKLDDMEALMKIIQEAIRGMRAEGSDQWNETYPQKTDFEADIKAGSLYVDENDAGQVRAVICLNTEEPPQYAGVVWTKRDQKALVIHRMAVAFDFRGQGIANRLMDFAESKARELGFGYLKSDTYSLNGNMNALFAKKAYKACGSIRFPERIHGFNCWDKVLS